MDKREYPIDIIMPVKDSIQTTRRAIEAILQNGYSLTVYDDFSSPENSQILDSMAQTNERLRIIHLAQLIQHPSPNYRFVLIHAQRQALLSGHHLLIVESDVETKSSTIEQMVQQVRKGVGLVAAITVDPQGHINFPYQYANHLWWTLRGKKTVSTCKRLSFCCTILTNELLQTIPFEELDAKKDWFDITISHLSRTKGLRNLLMLNNPVTHHPHSSRPWKQLKNTHPFQYYWRKITQHKDRI